MPRRRRRRGNTGGGCCSCLAQWTPAQEEVTTAAIKERSKTRLLGRFVNCSDAWYNRHRLQKCYILFGVLFGFMLFAVLAFTSNVYKAAVYLEEFKPTNCTVYAIDSNSTALCSGGNKRNAYSRKYTCLRVYVQYDAPQAYDNKSHTALLFTRYDDLKKPHFECTEHPNPCDRHGNVNSTILARENYFKQQVKKSKFECYYNPEVLDEVLLIGDIGITSSNARSYQGLMIFVVVVAGLVLLFFILTCGCQYVCTGTVPPEIRNAADGSVGGQDPNQPVIFTGAAVQMAPGAETQPLQTAAIQPGVAPPPGGFPQHQPYAAPQPGYPAPQTGYPAPQAGYPAPQPGYPAPQAGYPAPQPGYPAPQAGYPAPQPGYPPTQPVYPPQHPAYPPGFPNQPPPNPAYVPAPAPAPAPASAPAYQAPAYLGRSEETKVDLNA